MREQRRVRQWEPAAPPSTASVPVMATDTLSTVHQMSFSAQLLESAWTFLMEENVMEILLIAAWMTGKWML